MQIDIPSHIEKLLFLHESLVIPGFGGFTATRTPATTDYAGGTVSAPSKTLAFSENLTIDDGILVNDIMLTHGISAEDAQRVVAEFVEKMQSLLNQREIVTLSGVGRLYKNYVQKIQFLPDATNFNAASYGLPPLQFSPIARAREINPDPTAQDAPPAVTPPPMPEPTYAPERTRGSSSLGAALGVLLLLVALSAGIWYWMHLKKSAKTDETTKTEQVEPKNEDHKSTVTPPEETTPQEAPKTNVAPADDKSTENSLHQREDAVRKELKTGKLCILVVATLSVKENADKLKSMLTEEGFDVYYVHQKGHQVGIQFYYTNPTEINDKIATLQQLTGEKHILVKKK